MKNVVFTSNYQQGYWKRINQLIILLNRYMTVQQCEQTVEDCNCLINLKGGYLNSQKTSSILCQVNELECNIGLCLAGMELIFFPEADTVLCFGFRNRMPYHILQYSHFHHKQPINIPSKQSEQLMALKGSYAIYSSSNIR